MTDNTNNGTWPLPDDEMDEVAGGTNAADVAAQAALDGRVVPMKPFNLLCVCAAHNKWARSVTFDGFTETHYDVKCYKCGKTWPTLVTAVTV